MEGRKQENLEGRDRDEGINEKMKKKGKKEERRGDGHGKRKFVSE